MRAHRAPSVLLRRRSAVALAVVAGGLGVVAAHGFPAIGHNATGHDGVAVGDMAAVCLAVTATAATAAAALSRQGWSTRHLSFYCALVPTQRRAPALAARAGPAMSTVLRL